MEGGVMRDGWAMNKLGEVCRFVGGGTPSKLEPSYWNGGIPWASIKDMKGETLISTQDEISETGLRNSASSIAMPGEIILATRINPGRPIISKIRVAINQDLKIVKPKCEISTEYLYYSLRNVEHQIRKVSSGTTVLGINLNHLNEIPIPIAPLPEQKSIVAKIEELFSELDNGIANLQEARRKIDIYRQSVLKKAFEGELTKDWRSRQPNLPTGEELLAQIQAERQRHYEQQLADWKSAVKAWEKNGKKGRKPGKPKGPPRILECANIDNNDDALTPNKWIWLSLGDLSKDMCLGKMLDAKKNRGDLMPYLANINVRWGMFDLENLKKMRFESTELERYWLEYGDLVICEGGEPGRCAIWKSNTRMQIQKALHRVRFWKRQTSPDYIFYYLQFLANTGRLSKHFTGTTIKHL